MAGRLMALEIARRTRTSSSGFFGERLAVLARDERAGTVEIVEVEIDDAVRDLGSDVELRIVLEAGQVGGGHAFHRIDVAGEQRGDARRFALDDLERDLVPDRLVAPVVVVASEFDAVAAHVADELEAAAADRRLAAVEVVGRRVGGGLLRHDVDRRQVVGRQRIRRRIFQADRIRIDDLLADDGLGVGREAARAVGDERDAVDRERDILGGQFRAIVELHTLAQLVFPRRRVDRLPRRREARDHLRIRIHLHELVEDVLGDVVVGEQVEKMGIDRRDIGRDRDLEVGGKRGLCRKRGRGEHRANGQDA